MQRTDHNYKRTLVTILAILLSSISLISCTRAIEKTYGGSLLQQKDVAFVFTGSDVVMYDLDNTRISESKYAINWATRIEVLPGKHSVRVWYFGGSTGLHARGYIKLHFNAIPNHIYYIEAESNKKKLSWSAEITDISSSDEGKYYMKKITEVESGKRVFEF
jgi:hypothetical protein